MWNTGTVPVFHSEPLAITRLQGVLHEKKIDNAYTMW